MIKNILIIEHHLGLKGIRHAIDASVVGSLIKSTFHKPIQIRCYIIGNIREQTGFDKYLHAHRKGGNGGGQVVHGACVHGHHDLLTNLGFTGIAGHFSG